MRPDSRVFYGLSTAGALAILSSTMSKNPVLPLLSSSLGAEGFSLGLIASASTIPGILVSLPAGSLSDLVGRKRVMLVAAFVFATAPFMYLAVSTPLQLILVRFYHGFATAIFGPVANATIVDRYPSRKAERLSIFSSSTIAGRGIAPFLGGAVLILTNSNFKDVYWVVGAAGVSALIAIAFVFKGSGGPPPGPAERRMGIGHQVRAIVANRLVVIASYIQAVQYFTYGAFEFFVVSYAKAVQLDLASITLISGIQLVAVISSQPALGRLSDKFGRSWLIAIGLAAGGISLPLVPLTTSLWLLLAVAILYGLGFSAVTSSTSALVSDLTSGTGSGSAMGFLSTLMDVGQTSGPIVTGLILATPLGYLGAFWFLGFFLVLSVGPFAWSFMIGRRGS